MIKTNDEINDDSLVKISPNDLEHLSKLRAAIDSNSYKSIDVPAQGRKYNSGLKSGVPAASKSSYKYSRNEPCFCGSGRKYKNCCMQLVEIDSNTSD